jgi:hypothetical protein
MDAQLYGLLRSRPLSSAFLLTAELQEGVTQVNHTACSAYSFRQSFFVNGGCQQFILTAIVQYTHKYN